MLRKDSYSHLDQQVFRVLGADGANLKHGEPRLHDCAGRARRAPDDKEKRWSKEKKNVF